nr:MAG TPA: hypothetical protein [Caudoviricetes sp.]
MRRRGSVTKQPCTANPNPEKHLSNLVFSGLGSPL